MILKTIKEKLQKKWLQTKWDRSGMYTYLANDLSLAEVVSIRYYLPIDVRPRVIDVRSLKDVYLRTPFGNAVQFLSYLEISELILKGGQWALHTHYPTAEDVNLVDFLSTDIGYRPQGLFDVMKLADDFLIRIQGLKGDEFRKLRPALDTYLALATIMGHFTYGTKD